VRAKPFIARDAEPVPAAILRVASAQDAAAAVSFVREHDLAMAVRCGGHCSVGTSSTTGLLIDLSGLATVTVDGIRATVGGGALLGPLVERLARHGRALPAGTCPTVGVGGLTLGGGWGLLGRQYGLTSDHLVAAEIVTASGTVLTVDAGNEPDLFWALRGGGAGGFGIVTSLVFETRPAPVMTSFQYRWPFEHAARVIDTWQRWAIDAPPVMSASLGVSSDGGVPVVKLHGAMAAGESETAKVLDEIAADADEELAELDYLETARYHARRIGEPPPGTHVYAASEFFEQPLPAGTIGVLLEQLAAGSGVRELGFMPWGAAYGSVASEATAFPHREARFSVEHLAFTPAADRAAHQWVRRQWATAHPHGTGGVYANFQDTDLDDWARAYYGDNLDRLRRVKRHYDPDSLFRGPQALT
jgi:FAD/FMN-containing dehydrogenase